jgi:hypothetical protein
VAGSNHDRFAFDLPCEASDNYTMPLVKREANRLRKKPAKSPAKKLSNAALLKLAARHRPPQEWYDDETDPTRPAPSNGRGK